LNKVSSKTSLVQEKSDFKKKLGGQNIHTTNGSIKKIDNPEIKILKSTTLTKHSR
jgi:hypothetical protein